MGYVPQFNNDVFISYRHASNEAHDMWIDRFCKELRARLEDLVGEVTIWRDESEIQGGDQYLGKIYAALDTTAVFLAIISRTYLDSEDCRKELDRFLRHVKAATENIKSPIIPIFKHPPKPDQDLPLELTGIHRHEFFTRDPPGSNRFREFSPDKNDATSPLFWETLERLAQDIMEALEELKGYIRKATIGTIYLARVGPELHPAREKLRSDLQQRGYQIVPEREYFWNSSDLIEKITENLEAAELCVHLVSRIASIEPESPVRARLQLELATEAMKRKKKPLPLIWLQPAEAIDVSARELINYIEQDLSNEGVEFLEDSLEEFKSQIYAKLPSHTLTQISSVKVNEIAVIVEESDIEATGELNVFLVKELRLDPKRIIFSGTCARDPLSLSKTLASCGKCLIYWGGRSEEWVDEVLSHEAMVAYVGDKRLCVYAANPITPEKKTFLTTKAQTISAATGINGDELRKFLVPTEIVP